jgi:hypothetical protein
VGSEVDLCDIHGSVSDCDLPASLSEVQFVVKGLSDPAKLRVINPDGNSVMIGANSSVVVQNGVVRWRVLAPASGVWHVASTDSSAQLSVVKIIVPQHFLMVPLPDKPAPGSAVTFQLRPDGQLLVDLPSLVRQQFTLEMQRIGTGNPRQMSVHLVQRESDSSVLTLDPSSSGLEVGDWSASLLLETGGATLHVGDVTFPVRSATPTIAPVAGSSSATDVPTRTPRALAAQIMITPTPASPTPTPVPTRPPLACELVLQPTTTQVPSHRLSLKIGFPIRVFEPTTFSASLAGHDCPANAANLSLILSRHDGGAPCQNDDCAWVVRHQDAGTVSFQPNLGVSKGTAKVTRQATADLVDGATITARDEVDYKPVAAALLEHSTGVDYWLPIAALFGVLFGFSLLSTCQMVQVPRAQGTDRVRIRDLAVYDKQNRRIVRAGGLVWRVVRSDQDPPRVVMLRYLIGGAPVVRSFANPPSRATNTSFTQKAEVWLRWLERSAVGSPLADLGRSLVVLRRR